SKTRLQKMYGAYEQIRTILSLCKNGVDIIGIGSGKIIADVLNGDMTIEGAIDMYQGSVSNPDIQSPYTTDEKIMSKDIIMPLHMSAEAFSGVDDGHTSTPNVIQL